MKKKRLFLITLIIIILLVFSIHLYRILTAEIKVVLKKERDIEVYEEVKISDLIQGINGKIVEDKLLDTTKLGKHEVTFYYKNNDNIKVKYKINYTVKDTTKPLISTKNSITVTKGYDGELKNFFFCGDNYDNTPTCKVVGEYDFNEVNSYDLEFKAIDSSNNISSQKFTLYVTEPVEEEKQEEYIQPVTTSIKDVIKEYKTKNNKIGIDISRWQGEIDFKKVKQAGIEFVMIRVGSEDKDGNLFVDPKFKEYIKGFNKINMPVGIYYYSYADGIEDAKKEARWVIKQIKKYDVDLPIVFDWENWSNYREYNLSFHKLTEIADAFLNEIEKEGYEGMLYSSKYYLENIWYKTNHKVWLAHYTNSTDYKGDYYMWQLCSNGKVDGIDNNLVDIDILFN